MDCSMLDIASPRLAALVVRYPATGYETHMADQSGAPGADLPRVYRAEHVRQALAADPRVSELGLEIEIGDSEVWVRGHVATDARRRAALDVVRDACGECRVRDGIDVVAPVGEPAEEQL